MSRHRHSLRDQLFYKAYLASPTWRTKKQARIAIAGGRCEFVTTTHEPHGVVETRCARRRYLCVHHNTYVRLGREWDRDLDVFCWPHHMVEHILWKKCVVCTAPVLGTDLNAERWLLATLYQMGIDVDQPGREEWRRLPNKEKFLVQLPDLCDRCFSLRGGNKCDEE